ncbi:hypothetical protein QQS21_003773 [Conoideocrella luteorostrata]|uniref:Uncharacterized protein n=1 Tax=Conoideocrella luteorostrata TaxID=1105319 RepID=A0AAJ0CSN1_9HYPO|nr:hypothetical protein QQS21_003773 [Conoideocrella luteorostrata]
MFEGGYFQYGCGTASDLATTVVQSASGKGRLVLTSISVELTATPTPLSRPMTLSSESTETSGTSGSPVASDHPQPSTTNSDAAPSINGSDSKNTGAIIGGTVGGAAVIFAIAALAFFLWRRKSRNVRRGPEESQEPKPMRSMAPGNQQFEPFTSRQEVSEAMHPAMRPARPPANGVPMNRNSDGISVESPILGNAFHQPHHLDTVEEAGSRDGEQSGESDRVPLTRELDEFSHGFNTALEGIETDSDAENHNPVAYPGPRRAGGSGVLWQQNRRRSRNMAWM